jgi:NADH-quinone oxidoreductase subunit H
VEAQQAGHWNILSQPIGFIIFLICAFAECNRTPFDLPECETELIGGYHTEYSSMKLGFYLFAEYINMFISGAVMATLFFGGYDYPGYSFIAAQFGSNAAAFLGMGALIGKALFFVFIFMWVRWTLPRFRYDQLMGLGWTGLIPLSMFNVVVTGFGILIGQPIIAGVAGVVILLVGLFVNDALFRKKKIA